MLVSNDWVLYVLSPNIPGYVYVLLLCGLLILGVPGFSHRRTGFITLGLWVWFLAATIFTFFTGPVYVIHNDSMTRMRLVGMSRVPVTLSNGKQTFVPEGAVGRGMVINDSHRQVRVEEIPYYQSGWGPLSKHSFSIEPYSVARVDASIDHFGPDDPPPRTLRVSRHQSAAVRFWLTW
jgi:hypothetical protein